MLNKTCIGMAILVVLCIGLVGCASAQEGIPTPDGFEKTLVYMGAGKYDPSVQPEEGNLTEWYHMEIMNRTDAEIAEEQQAADAYFEEQFGPGLPPAMAFGSDPRNEYRAYYVSNESAPPDGWVVRDGGFMVMIPEGGMNLTGTWGGENGTFVPGGSFLVVGDYNILMSEGNATDNVTGNATDNVTGNATDNMTGNATDNMTGNATAEETMIIHYQSAEPIIPSQELDGAFFFRCTLSSDEFGEGIAQGVSAPQMEGNVTQANIRNVLTFPAFGPSIDHTAGTA
nr:hypothetical protein [Methanoculleus marisnigri]